MSPEQECALMCAWKGGGPCLLADCPRRNPPPFIDDVTEKLPENVWDAKTEESFTRVFKDSPRRVK